MDLLAPKQSIALVESRDGIHWSAPEVVLPPNPDTDWEKRINRPRVLKRSRDQPRWQEVDKHDGNACPLAGPAVGKAAGHVP